METAGVLEMLCKRLDTEKNVPRSLKEVGLKLPKIQSLLVDAECLQFSRLNVTRWIASVTDLANDVEDMLDEIAIQTLQSGRTSLVMIMQEISRITESLYVLMDESRDLGLQIIESESAVTEKSTGMEAALPAEAVVIGRHKDKEAIIERLLGDQTEPFSVVPICSMGGMGKTTLARIVYDDRIVEDHFDFRVWVRAAESLDALGLTRKVLQSIVPSRWDGMDLNGLQTKLRQILYG